jgi:replicative DNA helicase
VLGGLLLDNAAWDRVADVVSEGDFYRHEHRVIFGVRLADQCRKPADVITVYESLQNLGKAEEVGGLAYLNRWRSMCLVPATSAATARSCASAPSCASWSRPATRSPPTPSTPRASRRAHPRRGRAEDLRDRRGGLAQQAGLPVAGSLVVDLLDRVQEMADNPMDVTGVPTGFSTWTA